MHKKIRDEAFSKTLKDNKKARLQQSRMIRMGQLGLEITQNDFSDEKNGLENDNFDGPSDGEDSLDYDLLHEIETHIDNLTKQREEGNFQAILTTLKNLKNLIFSYPYFPFQEFNENLQILRTLMEFLSADNEDILVIVLEILSGYGKNGKEAYRNFENFEIKIFFEKIDFQQLSHSLQLSLLDFLISGVSGTSCFIYPIVNSPFFESLYFLDNFQFFKKFTIQKIMTLFSSMLSFASCIPMETSLMMLNYMLQNLSLFNESDELVVSLLWSICDFLKEKNYFSKGIELISTKQVFFNVLEASVTSKDKEIRIPGLKILVYLAKSKNEKIQKIFNENFLEFLNGFLALEFTEDTKDDVKTVLQISNNLLLSQKLENRISNFIKNQNFLNKIYKLAIQRNRAILLEISFIALNLLNSVQDIHQDVLLKNVPLVKKI